MPKWLHELSTINHLRDEPLGPITTFQERYATRFKAFLTDIKRNHSLQEVGVEFKYLLMRIEGSE
jgi:hypothetical protein